MTGKVNKRKKGLSRRQFLGTVGKGAAIGALAPITFKGIPSIFAATGIEQIKKRRLGKTELMISEIGIGAHTFSSWIKDCTDKQAIEILAAARDIGVNHIDADNPDPEHIIPSKAMRTLKARDDFILSVRDVHTIKGDKGDIARINAKVEERLKIWGVDHFDLLFMGTVFNDFIDHSYTIEALEKIKEQGKARFIGFGCHFSRENFLKAIDLYGDYYDVTSVPYNPYHRGAEAIFPALAEKDLGVIIIKPFAAGSLLKGKDLKGKDKDLPRKMLSYILANKYVHSVLPGFSSVEQGRENFSASWSPMTASQVKQMEDEYPVKPEIPGGAAFPKGHNKPPPGGRGAPPKPSPQVRREAAGNVQYAHIDWLKGWESA